MSHSPVNVFAKITDAIGNTPLVEIGRLNKSKAKVFAKLEYLNPGGSVKDRIGRSIIED
ncbi:MAG: pyridoxal-phosphate dependent enzyme, partial [Calditrichaeota bacterium]|nr:pyridoxal-phosphate dependent enzyme [Calditrichota bacterium]